MDGTVYKGEWRQGMQHGEGRLWLPDGSLKQGHFENNIYMGQLEGSRPTKST